MATILIVDDDNAMREGLTETVVDLGHRAIVAANGNEALALLGSREVDLVLLDLRMPGGLDGLEVLRRAQVRGNAPPVVILTAYAGADNTIEAMRLGAFDHLIKPIGRDDLQSLVLRVQAQAAAVPRLSGSIEQDGGLIGTSQAIRRVQKTIGLAADSDRYRQGAGGACPTYAWTAQGEAVHRVELCGYPCGATRERIIWSRRGCFYRRRKRPHRRLPRCR
jgi:DNA-binding NtrC family response regulator